MNSSALIGCATAIIFWGAASIFDKLAVKGIDPFSAVLVRMFFVTGAVLIFCLATDRLKPILQFTPQAYLYLLGSSLAGGLVGQLAYFMAIKHAPVTLVVPATATYPVVAFLLAVLFLREQPTVPKFLGVVLVVVGLALVSGGRSGGEATEADATTAIQAEAPAALTALEPSPPPVPSLQESLPAPGRAEAP